MYDRILIPVDGSEEARHAARHGLELAREFDATVEVLHVVERRALRLTRSAGEKKKLRERGEAVLGDIEELASQSGHSVTTTLAEGDPAVEISECADETNAELVVVGRQGVTGLGRRLLGGVTEQVLRRSDVPVLVVPGDAGATEPGSSYARILLPTDGSENAAAATPHAVTLARHYDTPLDVLNVVDLQSAGGPFDAGGLERSFVERLEAGGRETVDAVADDIGETAPDLAVETAVERTTSFDGAAAGIRDHVTNHDVDLVVMGSRGRSNLERHLLGSVASTVLRTVDVPVLVVPRAR